MTTINGVKRINNRYMDYCHSCNGTGYVRFKTPDNPDGEIRCKKCEGTGRIPSQRGVELLEFLVTVWPKI